MKDDYSRFTLRIPTDLIAWLKENAKDQSRSLNGQVVEYLKDMKLSEETKHA